jgi:transcriptional regulator with XRE-family HTH domain
MKNTVIRIGETIRHIRTERNLKLFETAAKAEISKGLLSKIENGRTIPSLPVLLQILKALEIDLTDFFKQVETDNNSPMYLLIKKKDYRPIEKEEAIGFQYFSIYQQAFSSVAINFTYLELKQNAQREMVTTDGYEFIHLVHGSIDYVLGNEKFSMQAGDSLFFNGSIPHVKKNPYKETAQILVVYILTSISQ